MKLTLSLKYVLSNENIAHEKPKKYFSCTFRNKYHNIISNLWRLDVDGLKEYQKW